MKRKKYIKQVKRRLFGHEQEFSMGNRMFSMACLAIIGMLFVCFLINTVLGLWAGSLIIIFVFVCECIFYYYSRFKKKFELSIIINALICYAALALNYFINSGIDGPTIFLFFFTLQVLIAGTPNRLHPWWLASHALAVTGLLLAEYYKPATILHNYSNASIRVLDNLALYIAALLITVIVTRHLRNYYLNEKYATENLQIKLKAFFDSSTNYHVLLNKQKEIIYFNLAAAQFAQSIYNKEMKAGESMDGYINPVYETVFNENFNSALEGHVINEEGAFDYNSVGRVWWQISFVPAKDKEGEIVSVSFNAVNINSRKEKEEKINQKNQSLTKIAYIQSNGLREPVASIIGLMNLIKEDKERSAEYLGFMEQATKELDKKIHEIVAQTKGASYDE